MLKGWKVFVLIIIMASIPIIKVNADKQKSIRELNHNPIVMVGDIKLPTIGAIIFNQTINDIKYFGLDTQLFYVANPSQVDLTKYCETMISDYGFLRLDDNIRESISEMPWFKDSNIYCVLEKSDTSKTIQLFILTNNKNISLVIHVSPHE